MSSKLDPGIKALERPPFFGVVRGGVAIDRLQHGLYVNNVGHEPPEAKTTPDWTLKPKDYITLYHSGAKPVKVNRQGSLSPLEAVEAAAKKRKAADAAFRKALSEARVSCGASEIARAAGVSRQRVYQILAA